MGWAQPIFFWKANLNTVGRNEAAFLAELLERTLVPMGYELVDLELSPKGRSIRLFIDKVENVDFERLEVSSPGLDRPVKKAADFERFAGEEAELRLHVPVESARKLKGVLRGCADGVVTVETARGLITIPLADIDRARLVPRIEWR
jgi:ribosome maturation factor RimP